VSSAPLVRTPLLYFAAASGDDGAQRLHDALAAIESNVVTVFGSTVEELLAFERTHVRDRPRE
jgi:hypothetical protein